MKTVTIEIPDDKTINEKTILDGFEECYENCYFDDVCDLIRAKNTFLKGAKWIMENIEKFKTKED